LSGPMALTHMPIRGESFARSGITLPKASRTLGIVPGWYV
jgi:hypothetical protein